MTDKLKDIVLDYPSTITREEILMILESYKAEHPEIYDQWEEVERHPEQYADDGLKEIAQHGYGFLRRNCQAMSNMGVFTAWASLRGEVIQAAFAQTGRKGHKLRHLNLCREVPS